MSFGYRFPPLPQVLDDRPSPPPPRPNHLSQGLDPTLRTLYEAQRTRLLFT